MNNLSVVNEVAELVKHLPVKLRIGLNTDALEVAIEENVISIEGDGRLKWKLENKTLLAHFCGRMWCGDTIVYNKRKGQWRWKLGERDFPEKDLNWLFGEEGLRNLRRQRNLCAPPFGFEWVDKVMGTHPSPLKKERR